MTTRTVTAREKSCVVIGAIEVWVSDGERFVFGLFFWFDVTITDLTKTQAFSLYTLNNSATSFNKPVKIIINSENIQRN